MLMFNQFDRHDYNAFHPTTCPSTFEKGAEIWRCIWDTLGAFTSICIIASNAKLREQSDTYKTQLTIGFFKG